MDASGLPPDDLARLIRTFTSMIEDTVRAAHGQCFRASEAVEGTDATFMFAEAAKALDDLRADPRWLALKAAGVPPSMRPSPTP